MIHLKNILRSTLAFLKLDLTKNLEYDRLTIAILKQVLKEDDNCIDVGCHKGEILEEFIRIAPEGNHFAFEPIPSFYEKLVERFPTVTIHNIALSNEEGEEQFNYVKNAPAYSGLKQRKYAVKHPEIEKITVQKNRLDAIIPQNTPIRLIKIDVEGGELNVLKGATEILKKQQPIIIFECGLGASDFYGTKPEEVVDLFDKHQYQLYLLKDFLHQKNALSTSEFVAHYNNNSEYYFIAAPRS